MDQIADVLSGIQAEFTEPAHRRRTLGKRRKPIDGESMWITRPDLRRYWAEVDAKFRTILSSLATGGKPWPLYLHGAVGCGKTRGALCLVDAVEHARYWIVEELKDLMVARRAPWLPSYRYDEPPSLAVLDELGTQEADRFEYAAVKRFLDWREGKPTIYISNRSLDDIGRLYDLRIKSRLGSGTVFHLQGPDRRKRSEATP